MADHKDIAASRAARREFGKRGVDASLADIRVHHGVCNVRGVLSLIKGSEAKSVEEAVQHVARLLRQKPEIKDVTLDVIMREPGGG